MISELCWWYGFDVGAMPVERRLGLWACLPRIQAQDAVIHERYDPNNEDDVYRLFLAAYGSEELAQQRRIDSMQQQVRSATEAARQSR